MISALYRQLSCPGRASCTTWTIVTYHSAVIMLVWVVLQFIGVVGVVVGETSGGHQVWVGEMKMVSWAVKYREQLDRRINSARG